MPIATIKVQLWSQQHGYATQPQAITKVQVEYQITQLAPTHQCHLIVP